MKILHWLPRILCILSILFISLFALDSFDPELSTGEQIVGFAIHLIPTFALSLFLIIAWRSEFIGGIIFTVIGLIFTPIVFSGNYSNNNDLMMSIGIVSLITVPFFIVGLLFIVEHYLKKKYVAK